MIDLIIVGAGGHGKEVYSYVQDLIAAGEKIRVRGFVDDGKPRGPFLDTEILGGVDELQHSAKCSYIVAVGDNPARAGLVNRVEAHTLRPWTLRHPSASVGADVEIGAGTLLAPGSVVTTHTRIGKHSILNVHASVSHDCVVGDFANINPGAAVCGNCRIGAGAYIGAGATVIDRMSVGAWTIVGAGAAVVEDVPERVTAVGVPARVIKRHSS